jgi:hypothetical protein
MHMACFKFRSMEKPLLLGKAYSKVAMFRRHHEILKQRLLRAEQFRGASGAKVPQ